MCRTVGARFAGRTVYAPVLASKLSNTFRFASCGRYFSAGSSRLSRPCSTSCITASDVTGFVIDAMRKIVSTVIGLRAGGVCDSEGALIHDAAAIGDHRDHAWNVPAGHRISQHFVDRGGCV